MHEAYDGIHSITFGQITTVFESGSVYSCVNGMNTWKDCHLIPSSRPLITPPLPNFKKVSIPGANGSLDLSDILTGYMTYQNRTGTWEFIVANDYWPSWSIAYSEIMKVIHGKNMVCVLDDEPEYYYEGMFSLNDWKSDKEWSKIAINYDVYPYKRKIQGTDEPWLWDPFNFEMDVITDYGNITVPANGSRTVSITLYDEPIIPSISSSINGVSLTANGRTFNLESGTRKYPRLKLVKSSPTDSYRIFTFSNSSSSSASVSVIFRGGEL